MRRNDFPVKNTNSPLKKQTKRKTRWSRAERYEGKRQRYVTIPAVNEKKATITLYNNDDTAVLVIIITTEDTTIFIKNDNGSDQGITITLAITKTITETLTITIMETIRDTDYEHDHYNENDHNTT